MHYGRSDVYARTVTVWRDEASVALYQREPAACWYATGVATVTAVAGRTLTLAWALPAAVWATARVPSQCVTLFDRGVAVHAVVNRGTTATTLAATVPADAASWAAGATVGRTLRFVLRRRPPTSTWPGPVVRLDPDHLLVQAGVGAIPADRSALVSRGGRRALPWDEGW